MEGSLPGIGLMLETPAALANSATPPAASNRFAALIGEGAAEPAAAPAGMGLPPAGPVLPLSAPLFKAVAGAEEPDLPAAVSTAPGDPLIPVLPGTMIDAAPLLESGIARIPDPGGQRIGLTEPISVDDVTAVQTTAAAPAEVVEMVRQVERDSSGQPDAGVRAVTTALSQGLKPDAAPNLPATHLDTGRLPERPAQILAQTVNGDPVVPAPALVPTSRAGLNPEPAVQAGIVTALNRQPFQDPASADGSDLPDLPFESIRVTVREAGGERPLPNRESAFQLPGPRQPLGDPQWARSLAERLAVVVRGEHQTARMSLNPAHLGPIDIQLRLQDDQAQLWLTAQHPQAREALESAMPRLREMFAQQGIDLSQQGSSGRPGEQGTDERTARPAVATATGSGVDDSEYELESVPARGPGRIGLFDAYA